MNKKEVKSLLDVLKSCGDIRYKKLYLEYQQDDYYHIYLTNSYIVVRVDFISEMLEHKNCTVDYESLLNWYKLADSKSDLRYDITDIVKYEGFEDYPASAVTQVFDMDNKYQRDVVRLWGTDLMGYIVNIFKAFNNNMYVDMNYNQATGFFNKGKYIRVHLLEMMNREY